jgi:hypothetical protein
LNTLYDTCLSSRSPSIAYAGNHQQKPSKRHIERFSDESVFSGNAATVVLRNGAALIFANFFQHCTAAEFVEITRTRVDHLPWQPTIAAELLLDGCKIEV